VATLPLPVTKLPKPKQFRPESELVEGERVEGVYLLLSEDGLVVYVGQSSNVCVRLVQHRSEARKQFSTALFYQMPGSTESERLWIEGALIFQYQPLYNHAYNVGMAGGKCWEIGFGRKRGKRGP
jgi:GIY-YIG catalytic domain-containing protein